MIYFDNAATTGKKPENVIKAVNNAMITLSANPGRSGHNLSSKAAEAVFSVREKIANFFGADGPEQVCFTQNCTHSLNCVIKGITSKGNRILTSSLEHNAVMRPIKKTGLGYDNVLVDFSDDDVTLSRFESKIMPNTKLLICTGASNVFGKTLPIKKIGELCHRKGVYFAVDSAQIAGVMPINMKEMNIDFLCIAPHKGLYAPMGTGILICRKNLNDTIIEGGTGTNSEDYNQPDVLPEKIESGTVNLPGIMGIGAGIDFVKNLGYKKIYNHEIQLIEELYNGLKKNKNIILYTPSPKKYGYAPVLSFNYKGLSSGETAKILSINGIAVRSGLHCAPIAHKSVGTLEEGTVRVSVSVYNNHKEIEKLIYVLSDEKNFKKL